MSERLPDISPEVYTLLKGSLDFVGINHYTTLYARNDRSRTRKFILQDASSDAAVITTNKTRRLLILVSSIHISTLFCNPVRFFVLLAFRGLEPIGDKVSGTGQP